MFDRIGDKLTSVGVWTVVAGCIGSILLGLLVLRSNPLLALLISVFGCAGSVLFGMIVYGLGTLICMFLVGPVAGIFLPINGRIIERLVAHLCRS